MGHSRLRGLKNFLLRQSVKWADHVLAISHAMVPELVEQYGIEEQRISVTPLGVDARWFERESTERIAALRQRYGWREQYLLFVGTLQPRKNVERISKHILQLPAARAPKYNWSSPAKWAGVLTPLPHIANGRGGWERALA